MKLSLPLKLGIFVVLVFSAVIAACLLWTPVKIRYYTAKLNSNNPKERVAGVEGLLGMGDKGVKVLAGLLGGGKEEAEFLSKNWKYWNKPVPGDKDKSFPLHLTAKNGFTCTARLLIEKGADVNAKANYDKTPLYFAAEQGNKGLVLLLLENGANANTENQYGDTAVHKAANNGHYEIVALLIKKDADFDTKDDTGTTPLKHAVWKGHIDIAKLLIEKGADIRARDRDGLTALFWAIRCQHHDVAAFLIGKGADVNEKGKNGRTVMDFVLDNNVTGAVEDLRSYGAKTSEELMKEQEQEKK